MSSENRSGDDDRLENALLGVELTCVIAIVGLLCFAAGWARHGIALTPDTSEGLPIATDPVVAQPLPGWVGTSLVVVVAVLLVAVAADAYLLLDERDVDVREFLDRRGGRSR